MITPVLNPPICCHVYNFFLYNLPSQIRCGLFHNFTHHSGDESEQWRSTCLHANCSGVVLYGCPIISFANEGRSSRREFSPSLSQFWMALTRWSKSGGDLVPVSTSWNKQSNSWARWCRRLVTEEKLQIWKLRARYLTAMSWWLNFCIYLSLSKVLQKRITRTIIK